MNSDMDATGERNRRRAVALREQAYRVFAEYGPAAFGLLSDDEHMAAAIRWLRAIMSYIRALDDVIEGRSRVLVS